MKVEIRKRQETIDDEIKAAEWSIHASKDHYLIGGGVHTSHLGSLYSLSRQDMLDLKEAINKVNLD